MNGFYELKREIIVNASVADVWAFFSSPHNLEKITPPYMGFLIVDCPDVTEIYNGMQIRYKVRPIANIPLTWVTLISSVEQGRMFADVQLKGPYKFWEHIHTFEPVNGGVLMKDHIRYKMPFGILGRIVNRLKVQGDLERIFNYREAVIKKIFA